MHVHELPVHELTWVFSQPGLMMLVECQVDIVTTQVFDASMISARLPRRGRES